MCDTLIRVWSETKLSGGKTSFWTGVRSPQLTSRKKLPPWSDWEMIPERIVGCVMMVRHRLHHLLLGCRLRSVYRRAGDGRKERLCLLPRVQDGNGDVIGQARSP